MRRRELPGGIPPPTKTELKRRALAVQDLADRLVAAPEEVVCGLELPAKLADAVALARRITSRTALLRQRQFVAKLLRAVDCEPIRAALDSESHKARAEAARFRRAERWRDRLLADSEVALADFMVEFPASDRARLSGLVAVATDERKSAARAAAARELFRAIRELVTASVAEP